MIARGMQTLNTVKARMLMDDNSIYMITLTVCNTTIQQSNSFSF